MQHILEELSRPVLMVLHSYVRTVATAKVGLIESQYRKLTVCDNEGPCEEKTLLSWPETFAGQDLTKGLAKVQMADVKNGAKQHFGHRESVRGGLTCRA